MYKSLLNNIARKLNRERRSGVTPPRWKNNPLSHFSNEIDHESLIEQFIANLHTLHTEVSHIHRSEIGVHFSMLYINLMFNLRCIGMMIDYINLK